MDATLSTFIPGLLLVLLNALIVYKIVASRRAMQTSRAMHNARPCSSAGTGNNEIAGTTIVLFAETASFLVFNVPFELFWNTELFVSSWPPSPEQLNRMGLPWCAVIVIRGVCVLLKFASNALNFVMYMLTGSKFRKAFKEKMCRPRQGIV